MKKQVFIYDRYFVVLYRRFANILKESQVLSSKSRLQNN